MKPVGIFTMSQYKADMRTVHDYAAQNGAAKVVDDASGETQIYISIGCPYEDTDKCECAPEMHAGLDICDYCNMPRRDREQLRATIATLSANLRAAVGMVQDFYNWFDGASGYKNKPALLARARAVLAAVEVKE